jgi:hypothetical protein
MFNQSTYIKDVQLSNAVKALISLAIVVLLAVMLS